MTLAVTGGELLWLAPLAVIVVLYVGLIVSAIRGYLRARDYSWPS